MLIKDLTIDNLLSVAENNNNYNSDEWFLFIRRRLAAWIRRTSSGRHLFPWIATAEDPTEAAAKDIDVILEFNAYKYRHLWELYVAKYNPIWNVDGTESETITRQKRTERDMNRANTGTQTATDTGTTQNQQSGSDTLGHGHSVTESGTTYDSGTYYGRNKTENGGTDTTTYGRKDTRTDNLTNTRTDNLNEKTDDDSEENETITTTRTRGGNIGVTMTQAMEKEEKAWAESFRLLEDITADICGAIAYNFM